MLTTDTPAGKPGQDLHRPTNAAMPTRDQAAALLLPPPGWVLWGA